MRHKHKPDAGSTGVQLGLIVTPMLDMAFQILAFFIATYNPSALEMHIPGSLIPPENPATKSKDPNPMPQIENPLSVKEEDLMPELNEAVLVRAKAIRPGEDANRAEGALGDIFIKLPLQQDEALVAAKALPMKDALALLQSELARELAKAGFETREDRLKSGSKKSPNLKLAADGELRQEYVMMVYSAAKKAGYDNIHFVPPALPTKLSVK
jgi:biopolymer transport protein ExbD